MKHVGRVGWLLLWGLLGTLGTASPTILDQPAAAPPAAGLAVHTRWKSLELTLEVPKGEFRAGEPVEARLTLENVGDAPTILGDVPFQTFDLIVYDVRGAKVWAWFETRPPLPLALPGFQHLNRAETWGGALAWDQTLAETRGGPARPAPRGKYFLEGLLHATVPGGPPPVTLKSPRLGIVLKD